MLFNKRLVIPFKKEIIWIEIFDPEFYLDTNNFMTIPKTKFVVEPDTWVQINLKAEYFEMLNRPTKQCNGSTDYSFTKCVKVTLILELDLQSIGPSSVKLRLRALPD